MCWKVLLFGICSAGFLFAQTPDPQPLGPPPDPARPPLTPVPAEGDWLFLRDTSKRQDWLDRLKYIPLGPGETVYLSIGGEYRGEYERSDSTAFGSGPQDTDGYYLQRLLPHFDLHLGSHFRVFTEFQFDDAFGRNGGPRPGIDRDRAAFHQTFAEFGSGLDAEDGTRLRVGRQELQFGSGRFVDDNEGVNVKFSFDGARLKWKRGPLEANVFAAKPVQINPGVFDDSPDFRRSFWGVYTTVPTPIRGVKADIYYLGLDTKSAAYFSGAGSESRSSFGIRIFNRIPGTLPFPGLDYNWEAMYQAGSFAGRGIRAWSIPTETGYTWRKPLEIRVALRVGVASGDSNSTDRRLGTFNPLFPRGAFFGPKLVLIQPANIFDVHPVVFLHPRQNVTISVEGVWFWRTNLHDGVYAFGGMPLRPGTPLDPRFIGTQSNLEIRWAVTPHVTIALNPAVFITGSFLQRASLPAHNIAFVNLGLTYRF